MTFTNVFDTGLHADCVSFVPNIQSESIALFSCYELEESTSKRLGKLLLAERIEEEQESSSSCSSSVKVLQEVSDIPGVFEFTWFPETDILVTALAEGPPKLYKYDAEEKKLFSLVPDSVEDLELEMTLAVSGTPECFLTCDNKGNIRQWNLGNSSNIMEIVRCWTAHDAEIWYVSQDLHDRNLFYSGSDDFSLKIWDVRSESQVAVNKSGHESGVCCIKSSPWDEFVIATGSYDEKLRLWDRRMMRSAALKTVECGSGVWRVNWNPREKNLMAVAAMRAGFHIIDLEKGIIQTELVDDHVAYGIDWHPNGRSLASCSFYNNQGQFFQIE